MMSCSLSDQDRHTIGTNKGLTAVASLSALMDNQILGRSETAAPPPSFTQAESEDVQYLENSCAPFRYQICDFRRIDNRILKTVDAVFESVKTHDECRQTCVEANFPCRSFDLGHPESPVCRISHLDSLSLGNIDYPYLDVQGAANYEATHCYNGKCGFRDLMSHES